MTKEPGPPHVSCCAHMQNPWCLAVQVVLPVAPDIQVPDWFYELTGIELKQTVMALVRPKPWTIELGGHCVGTRRAFASSGSAAMSHVARVMAGTLSAKP